MSQEIVIERVEELRLTDVDESEIHTLIGRSFSNDYQGRSFFQNRHHCRFLHRIDTKIAGHLAVAYRAIHMGERRIDIIGIGEVVVDTNHRQKGIGTALLNSAIEEGRLAGADFATLFGEQNIYVATGFKSANNMITLSEMEAAHTGRIVKERNEYFMVKQLGNLAWDHEADIDLAGFPF